MLALQPMPTVEQWASRINAQCVKSVESIVEIGRLLIEAKNDLPRGDWCRLFDDKLIPMDHDKAERLMSIARNPILSNSALARNLPPRWAVLADLLPIPSPTLQTAIDDGTITPTTTRPQIKAFRQQRSTQSTSPPTPIPARHLTRVQRTERLDRIRQLAGDGHSVRQIAAAVGLSEDYIRLITAREKIDVPAERVMRNRKRLSSVRMMEQTVFDAEGLTADLHLLDWSEFTDADQLRDWYRRLRQSKRRLATLIARILTIERKVRNA